MTVGSSASDQIITNAMVVNPNAAKGPPPLWWDTFGSILDVRGDGPWNAQVEEALPRALRQYVADYNAGIGVSSEAQYNAAIQQAIDGFWNANENSDDDHWKSDLTSWAAAIVRLKWQRSVRHAFIALQAHQGSSGDFEGSGPAIPPHVISGGAAHAVGGVGDAGGVGSIVLIGGAAALAWLLLRGR